MPKAKKDTKPTESETQDVKPVHRFLRAFISVYEDFEEQGQVEEKRWKNYDGYHFVSRVIKPIGQSQADSQTAQIKKNMKYAVCIPLHLISTLGDLVKFL